MKAIRIHRLTVEGPVLVEESRSQNPHHFICLEEMQERERGSWMRPRCIAMVIALEFLVTLIVLANFRQTGPLSLSSRNSFVSIRSSAQATKEGHRHLLDIHDGFSSNSSTSSNDGIRGVLIHRPSECSALPADTNSSAGFNGSKEAERVQRLKCALQRSSSRVGFLLSRKSRDRETVAYGLPTKDIAPLQESDGSELDGTFLRELLDSQEWEESYESEVWSQPGEYLMTIEVGNPPRTLKAIVDTGSDLTWLQCRRCERCYEQSDPFFQPRDSSTYRELDCEEELCESLSTSFCNIFSDSCDYLYSYGDSSYTYGSLSTDTFTLRSSSEGQTAREFPQITFGCSHASRGTFIATRADGVVALGRGALSLASQLGTRLSDRFGYCLVSRSDPTSITSSIYFGDAAILTGPGAGYTPILTNERHRAYYYLNMTGVSVGGKRLDISPDVFAIADAGRGGTILDSGTTVTNLGGPAYDALAESFREATDYPASSSATFFDLCFDVGDNPEPQFPSLVFHLDGVDLDMPQENYMVEAEDRTLCLAIDRSSDSLTVIGNVQQQNYRVLYDRQNTRLGFQPSVCAQVCEFSHATSYYDQLSRFTAFA